jgi:hypothetical protein
MRNLKKILGYIGTALAVGVGLFFAYAMVRGIVLGTPEQHTRRLKWILLTVGVPAAVTACVKLWQKYSGEKAAEEGRRKEGN